MKQFIQCFSLSLLLSATALAQSNSAADSNKYRIKLPDYWKPGNKIWMILTDKLPLVAEELKDKQICGDDCNPKYSIEFEMSEPEILDYQAHRLTTGGKMESWEIVTLYTFSSSLFLFDENDKLLTRFILVDSNEVWKVTNRIELPGFTPKPPMKIYVLKPPYNQGTDPADMVRNQEIYTGNRGGLSPYAYINKNKDGLAPTTRHMLDVVDRKIRSW